MDGQQQERRRRVRTPEEAKNGVLSEQAWSGYQSKLEKVQNGQGGVVFSPREALQFLLEKRELSWGDLRGHAVNIVGGRAPGAIRSIAARRGGFADSSVDFLSQLTHTKPELWRDAIPADVVAALEVNCRKLFSAPDRVMPRSLLFNPRKKRREFKEKISALDAGNSVEMTAGEYLQYVLIKRGIADADFTCKLEVALGYIGQVFSRNTSLPADLVRALVEMSDKDAGFWSKAKFVLPQDGVATLDLTQELTAKPRSTRANAIAAERAVPLEVLGIAR